MKRVCIVTPDLAGPTRNGGVGTHCLYLARFLAAQGQEVTIIHTGPPDATDQSEWRKTYASKHGASVRFLEELSNEPAIPVLPHTARHHAAHRVHRWLKTQGFATIHFQDWQGNGAICARAKHTGVAYANTRLVVTVHGSSEWVRAGMQEFPQGGRESLIDDSLERTAVALADTVVSPSHHMREWLRAHHWSVPRDFQIAPYLFEAPLERGPARALAANELREVVFFGRLETRKGLEPFLRAIKRATARRLATHGSALHVHLLGKPHQTTEGPALAFIAQVAAEAQGNFDVTVHDSLDHQQALTWLLGHPQALVVTPSLADNLPFAVIECLALGQPLLAAQRGGIPELIASPEHLVEPTETALASRLSEIQDHGLPACRPAWSEAAARRAWQNIADLPSPLAPPSAKPPRITVCIPHFNSPGPLGETLAALAAQTQAPFELIVADDGSDPMHNLAWGRLEKKYAARGWAFIREAHAGPGATRNAAAAHATGDAIVFCDADNRPEADMLDRLARALASAGSDIVTCAFIARRSTAEGVWADQPEHVFCPIDGNIDTALLENFVGDTNFIVRRPVFAELGGFDATNLSASEDWQFLLRAILTGRTIAILPEPVFTYRLEEGSHARRHSPRESAEAAWSALPEAELRRYARLIDVARGTFEVVSRLTTSPVGPTIFEATRQHASNLEQILAGTQAELRATHQHAENLERFRRALRNQLEQLSQTLADTRRNMVVLVAELRKAQEAHAASARVAADTKEALEDTRSELRTTHRANDELSVTLHARAHEIEILQDQAKHREDKLRRLQATWSWRWTAPFRAMRRVFVDRLIRRGDATQRTVPAPLPRLLSSVDIPTIWDAAPSTGSISGWCVFADGTPVAAVRAKIGETEIAGRYGQRRPDVATAHNFTQPAAIACGFQIPYRLAVDADHPVLLEAQTADGRWLRIYERTLHTSSFPRAVRDYTAWLEAFGSVSPERASALRSRLAALPSERRPLLSVVMPVYNPPEKWLARAIESVREQLNEHWEFCIADDASTQPHVREVLERFARLDPRIRVVWRQENGHISRASNSALELVRGDYVVLLDHDDEIPPDALAEVALVLAAHPQTDIVYSDEDKIDDEGRRYNPYFKPDFLPDLLAGQNCLSHLSVFRTALVREVGGFRAGFEGSQDWDLGLRLVEKSSSDRIRHIPRVLYHWRAIGGSTAIEVTEKRYSLDAARRALHDHFARRGLQVAVQPVPGSHWRITYPLPEKRPVVSIVIPSRNAARLLRTCVESIAAHNNYAPIEFVVVNNRSDETDALLLLDDLRRRENVRVVDFDAPFNFSAIVNCGVRQARGELVCLLNNDIEAIDDGWLTEMASHALRPEIGAVGAKLYFPDRTIQHAGVILGLGGVANHAFSHHAGNTDGYMNRARLVQNYSAVTAACLLIRKSIFTQVGGFNETDLAVAFNDIDFCLRVRAAGYRNLWTPFAELLHHESATRGHENTPEKQMRFEREVAYMRRTWGDQLDHDPAYNVNLALSMEGWDLAWPPRQ